MTELERLRHSSAHVLATAILRIWPEAQFAAGPPVEQGFYYDVELPHRITPEDFGRIEAEMKKETKANHVFERVEVTRDEAIALAKEGRLAALGARPEASKFKLDIVERIPEGETITLYRNGDFTDLCAGPHVMRTGNIGAFRLTHVASAYYKGDESNPQLQRIYGTAFKNRTALDEHFAMLEEAKKRDHRRIGQEMGLFAMDAEFVGPGLPLWLPKGTAIVEELEKLAKETEFAAGYVRVRTPHVAREKMYVTSGHLPYYAESMFPAMILDEGRVGVPPADAGILPGSRSKASGGTPDAAGATPTLPASGASYSKRRRLPHFEKPWAIYALTITTRDHRVLTPASRTILLDALRHFDGQRYELFAACVMPDHAHFLLQPWIKEQSRTDAGEAKATFWSLGELMHSIKSFTAKKINEAEGTTGEVWEQERFDRYIRGDEDLAEKFHYILGNPVRTGLPHAETYEWIWPNPDSGRVGVPPADAGILPGSRSKASGGTPDAAGATPTLPADPDRYYLKAMNCPHHHRIFAAEPHSYRDLPLRLAEYGCCYRYEQSGELFGLMRVRSLNMNDAHIYCTEEQFAGEFRAVNEMYLKYFAIFGLGKYQMRFSTHDPAKLGQKFVDEPALWQKTEAMVRQVLVESGIDFVEVPNEAAFYGPKIDVQVWSAIGREFTIATNQVDFAVPRKFGLTYKTRDNTEATPLCIHRAPLGTHERFIGFLIEHYAGNFPLWLAPDQVRIVTIGEDEALVAYAKAIHRELRAHEVRADIDLGSDPMKAKIADAEKAKVHTMLVIGARDLEAGNVSVRLHGKGNVGAKPRAEAIADILAAIKERRAEAGKSDR